MKTFIAALLALSVLCTSTPLFAAAEGSGGAMIADAFIVRPVGIVAIVAGTAAFVASLPFSLISGSTGNAARTLVAAPAKFTFARPLGCFDQAESYGGESNCPKAPQPDEAQR